MELDRLGWFIVCVALVIVCVTAYNMGYHAGQQNILQEALDMGAAELIENYQTMNYEFRWIEANKKRE